VNEKYAEKYNPIKIMAAQNILDLESLIPMLGEWRPWAVRRVLMP
jgi:hypothetical protein